MASNSKNIYAPASSQSPYVIGIEVTEQSVNTTENTSVLKLKGYIQGSLIGFNVWQKNPLILYWTDNGGHKKAVEVKRTTVSKVGYGSGGNSRESVEGTIKVSHNSDGNLRGWATTRFEDATGGTVSYVPPTSNVDTSAFNLTAIDRKAPVISNVRATPSLNSVYVSFSCDSEVDRVQYNLGSGWVNASYRNDRSFTINGLKPDTNYDIQIDVKKKKNQVWASTKGRVSVRTKKPNAPTEGKANVSNVTAFQATLNYSGFSFSNQASWGYFQVAIGENFDSVSWVNNGRNASYTKKGLKPNMNYKAWVRLVDNYGTPSAVVEVSFKTLSDQAKVWVNVNKNWKLGKTWVNVNGEWKKAKKVYVNVNGVWKANKS